MAKAVSRLFQLRKALDECEKEFGLAGYSEVEKAVFSYISSNANATITSVFVVSWNCGRKQWRWSGTVQIIEHHRWRIGSH